MTISAGTVLGISVIVFYALAALNAAAKPMLKKAKALAPSQRKLGRAIESFARFLIKNHRILGRAAAVFLVVHATVQYVRFGPSPTGIAAALLLVGQVTLGAYGAKTKKRGGWLIVHRLIALLLPAAMMIHIL